MDVEQLDMLARYEHIAKVVTNEWRRAFLERAEKGKATEEFENLLSGQMKLRLGQLMEQAFEEYLLQRIANLNADEMQKVGDRLLTQWMKDGEVAFNTPTEKVKNAIEDAFESCANRRRVFLDAVRQRKIEALAMSQRKVPIDQIAKHLGITKRTAKDWIEEEKEELKDLLVTLSIYGYKAAPEQ
jgi:hypothetical protein